jgi:hypothetical protein
MPLNNPEEDVSLLDSQGQVRHYVSCTTAQAASGAAVVFECAEILPIRWMGRISAHSNGSWHRCPNQCESLAFGNRNHISPISFAWQTASPLYG